MTLRRALALLCIGTALFAVLVPFEIAIEFVELAPVTRRETPRVASIALAPPCARIVVPTNLPRASLS